MKQEIVTIPEPCHLKWQQMTPINGSSHKHCGSCDTIIIDFESMSDAEIKAYFQDHKTEKICGHIKTYRASGKLLYMQKPIIKLYEYMNSHRQQTKMVAMVLVLLNMMLFTSSCGGGDEAYPYPVENDSITNDSTKSTLLETELDLVNK